MTIIVRQGRDLFAGTWLRLKMRRGSTMTSLMSSAAQHSSQGTTMFGSVALKAPGETELFPRVGRTWNTLARVRRLRRLAFRCSARWSPGATLPHMNMFDWMSRSLFEGFWRVAARVRLCPSKSHNLTHCFAVQLSSEDTP